MNSIEDIFNFFEGDIEIRMVSLKIEVDKIEEKLNNELESEIRTRALIKKSGNLKRDSLFRLNYHSNIKPFKIGMIRN